MASEKSLIEKIKEIVTAPEVTVEEIETEIWEDLSYLYYKYEDEIQKDAFRNVMKEIAHKIETGSWKSIYQKLYRLEHDND